MRVVRFRSIPNVDDNRLHADRVVVHHLIHTPEGLADWDGSRREMINLGMKGRAIAAELERRGYPPPVCRYCGPSEFRG